MTNKEKEKEKLGELSSKLTQTVGMLLVPVMKDDLTKQAKEQLSEVSFKLDRLLT